MSRYLVYHHNDMDGKGAANEIYTWLTMNHIQPAPSSFIQRGYDEEFNSSDYANKVVFIVDLSFTKESIKKLFAICEGASKVIWMDHHESSVKVIEDDDIREKLSKYKNLKYFVNQQASGAMLCYLFRMNVIHPANSINCLDCEIEYVGDIKGSGEIRFTDEEANSTTTIVPLYIKYIDLWDRWVYGDYTMPVFFNYGVGLHHTGIFAYPDKTATEKTYNEAFWKAIKNSTYINRILDEGKIAKKYFDHTSRSAISSRSYECTIQGHKALVVNAGGNSQVFGDKIKDYDLVVIWTYNGKNGLYQYSLYSDGKVNCAEIATSINPEGGGHPGAAGFSSDKLLFKKS